jgi:type II secretory ATPase GspE/PulE/Tfp pilus assembly ATPase PilB-like protein
LGIEPFLVASSVLCVVAQRLVRTICPECKEVYVPDPSELMGFGLKLTDIPDGVLWKGRGCEACFNTGYLGRMAIHESLLVTQEIREIIMESGERIDTNAIREAAKRHGMQTLRRSGLELVKKGTTTVEEIIANTTND